VTFAADTVVSVEKSKAELDRLLQRYGAAQRVMGSDELAGMAVVGFTMAGRQVRIQVPLPSADTFPDPAKNSYQGNRRTPRDWDRWGTDRRRQWVPQQYEQACRSRWRAIVLVVKAKLELVSIGMSTVEREFLADIALPDGRTVHSFPRDSLARSYLDGSMPPLLGMGSEK
jgi:hypothetical protein